MQVDKEVDPTITGEGRTLVKSRDMIREIKDQRTEQAKAQLRTRYGLKEVSNPMLSLSADPSQVNFDCVHVSAMTNFNGVFGI